MRRRPRAPRDPARLDGTSIGRVLAELGYDANAPALQLLRSWESAVGSELAAHCEPHAWRGKILELSVASPVWAQEVALRRTEILAALREVLGDAAPTELRTRVG